MKVKWFAFLTCFTVLVVTIASILAWSRKELIAQPQQEVIPKAYVEALEDAAQSDPDEVLEHLTLIQNPDSDPNLYWDNNGRVLVATFTGEAKFDLSTKTKIWVTAVPQLKNFCTNYRADNPGVDNQKLNERIEQLLGIRPYSQKTHIAEIWVDPTYLIRPIDDPNPSSYDKEPILQRIQQSSLSKNLNDQTYQDWFEGQIGTQSEEKQHQQELLRQSLGNRENYLQNYQLETLERFNNNNPNEPKSYQDDPYPWTGLGYTYDWGAKPEQKSEVGLSEFVIFLPSQDSLSSPLEVKRVIQVKRVFSTEEYCN